MIRFHVLAYTRLNQAPCWLCLTTSLLATERIAIEGQRFSLLFTSEKLFSFVSIHLQEKRPKRLVSTSSATWRPVLSAATTTRRTNVAMTTKFATFARAVSACRVHSRRCLLVGEDGYIMDPDSLNAWWTHVPWLVKIDSNSLLTKTSWRWNDSEHFQNKNVIYVQEVDGVLAGIMMKLLKRCKCANKLGKRLTKWSNN